MVVRDALDIARVSDDQPLVIPSRKKVLLKEKGPQPCYSGPSLELL